MNTITEQAPNTRPLLTIADAIAATGLSRASLMRALDAGKFPNAAKDAEPPYSWRIPVTDLLAAGYRLNRPNGGDTDPEQAGDTGPDSTGQVGGVISAGPTTREISLEIELTKWRALAEERERTIRFLETRSESADRRLDETLIGMRALMPAASNPVVNPAMPEPRRSEFVDVEPSTGGVIGDVVQLLRRRRGH